MTDEVQEVTLTEIYRLALDTIGDQALAADWLETRVPALGYKRPRDCFGTAQDRYQVWVVLMRIQHGVFA